VIWKVLNHQGTLLQQLCLILMMKNETRKNLETPISSEGEISKRNYRKFKLSENGEQVRYHVGQIFENVELVKHL
jgi:hypothetical protein